MSKTTTNNNSNATKNEDKVAKPVVTATETGAEVARPMANKARYILLALADGPLGRKAIVEKCMENKTPISGPDTTSYIGSIKEDIRAHWDRVAANPEDKKWNHVSLIGRGLVEYDAASKAFKLSKKGESVTKAMKEEEAKAKA